MSIWEIGTWEMGIWEVGSRKWEHEKWEHGKWESWKWKYRKRELKILNMTKWEMGKVRLHFLIYNTNALTNILVPFPNYRLKRTLGILHHYTLLYCILADLLGIPIWVFKSSQPGCCTTTYGVPSKNSKYVRFNLQLDEDECSVWM